MDCRVGVVSCKEIRHGLRVDLIWGDIGFGLLLSGGLGGGGDEPGPQAHHQSFVIQPQKVAALGEEANAAQQLYTMQPRALVLSVLVRREVCAPLALELPLLHLTPAVMFPPPRNSEVELAVQILASALGSHLVITCPSLCGLIESSALGTRRNLRSLHFFTPGQVSGLTWMR